ncbi:transglutaminase-like cysteine peptidase [Yanghanlia caeni]|uniref:transglutaminase-like cysteine peptidase n=1 Tax=Yanghanlia caeni TaxID=3064283 RepID=UPI003D2FBF73
MHFTAPRYVALCLVVVFAAWLVVAGRSAALQFNRATLVQHTRTQHGAAGAQRVERWLAMLERAASEPDVPAQLVVVNAFWNRNVREGVDAAIWKQEDYWATPLETLGRGIGDCEDFVIGKYFSLVHLGVPPDRLRLIYVRAQVGGASIAHMVLGYYTRPDAEPLILDNLRDSIQSAAQRRDLTPVFSFNADGVYVAGAARASVDRISRWQGLLLRMQQEGFQP